ncbi:hypothetical protein MJH54_31745, partial [Salmonella enterica subsp. enterica serovar Montevideo]|nr:hypothetical protein [Salmonella enterica subsp. enterica serovar Montevideo]
MLASYPLSVGILAGQWIALHRYLQQLEALNQPLLHLDLMDGHAGTAWRRISGDGNGIYLGDAKSRGRHRSMYGRLAAWETDAGR